MSNTGAMSAQSAWFQQYEKEVNGARGASNGNKKILIIIPILLIGGMIAMMIKNGALQNEEMKGGLYALIGVGVILLLMILILIGKSGKKDAAAITRKDLDALLTSAEDAGEFDAQMKANPVFKVENSKDSFIFATKDYLGTKFLYQGDQTYRFIKISDIALLHTVSNSRTGHCDVDFYDGNKKILLSWVADKESKVSELKTNLQQLNLNLRLT